MNSYNHNAAWNDFNDAEDQREYQREVERQRKMVLKAEHAHQRLLLVVQGLKKLFGDEHFVNLLRAEGLDTLPKYLAERIDNFAATT